MVLLRVVRNDTMQRNRIEQVYVGFQAAITRESAVIAKRPERRNARPVAIMKRRGPPRRLVLEG